jgi:hypothetical protein
LQDGRRKDAGLLEGLLGDQQISETQIGIQIEIVSAGFDFDPVFNLDTV